MSLQYSYLAAYYDRLNSHINYEEWARMLSNTLRKGGVGDGSLVLDLACGTGNITLPLSKLGYDMIGIDLSYEMLDLARSKEGGDRVLWIAQDMRSFELYGTVAAVVCCLDSINYLTGTKGLSKCFSLVHNYLDPDGLFVFDVNSKYKFEHIYGENHYIIEGDGVYCGWKNHYDRKSGLCDFELSIFARDGEGEPYIRFDELQRERYWSTGTLISELEKAGFKVESIASDLDMSEVMDDSERLFFVCRAIK